MKVVLADIEQPALVRPRPSFKPPAQTCSPCTPERVQSRRRRRPRPGDARTYGAVHLLCNNAGVGAAAARLGSTLNDWKWVMGVNLWGVTTACAPSCRHAPPRARRHTSSHGLPRRPHLLFMAARLPSNQGTRSSPIGKDVLRSSHARQQNQGVGPLPGWVAHPGHGFRAQPAAELMNDPASVV